MDAKVKRPLNELGAVEVAQKIAAGETICEAVVRDCLARIEKRDGAVKAWVNFNPELSLAQAHAVDRGAKRGPLHGVPVGIKDIIDTFDMPTEMGSPIYRGHRPPVDASCVALMRRAGAVILGKTVTCEFAGMAPGVTTNPHNAAATRRAARRAARRRRRRRPYECRWRLVRKPRPARCARRSSCTLARLGFKPTYNTFNKMGVWPAAESIDTIGIHARSIDDIELLTAVLRMQAPQTPRKFDGVPRIGLCRTEIWNTAQPETKAAIDGAAAALGKAGATVSEITLPDAFNGMHGLSRTTINFVERAACMAFLWDHHREALSPQMQRYVEGGQKTSREEYVAAFRCLDECRALLGSIFDKVDALLVPCVPGEAPKGLEFTGDASMQAIWTALHTPSITLPTHRGPNNLPVGIQLVGQRYEDDRLLAVSRWVWQKIGVPEMVGCGQA